MGRGRARNGLRQDLRKSTPARPNRARTVCSENRRHLGKPCFRMGQVVGADDYLTPRQRRKC